MDLILKIENKYGRDAMLKKWVEELTELSLALQHWDDDKTSTHSLMKEIADVKFCIEQMEYLIGNVDPIVNKIKKELPEKIGL